MAYSACLLKIVLIGVPGLLTNSRQLFPRHHVEDPAAVDAAPELDRSLVTADDLADDGGFASERIGAHRCEHRVGIRRRDAGNELSFVGDIERIEPKDLARAFDRG